MDTLCRDTLPSRASRDKLSFSSSYAWREEWRRVQCHPSVYNNTPQLTETHTTWYVTTNCFYRLQELFWVVCMVLNVLRNHRLAFTHVLKWNPFLVLLCKMFPYFFYGCNSKQQAPHCWWVGDLLSRILLKLQQVLVSVVFYLLSPLLIFQ